MKVKTRLITVEVDENICEKLMYNKKRYGMTIHHQVNCALASHLSVPSKLSRLPKKDIKESGKPVAAK